MHTPFAERNFASREANHFVEGKVEYREKQRATPIEARGSVVMTVNRTIRKRRAKRGHAAFTETPISLDALKKLGGFELEFYWYNRLIVEGIENLTEKQDRPLAAKLHAGRAAQCSFGTGSA